MADNMAEMLRELELELAKRYDEEKEKLMKKLGLHRKKREFVFICSDNGRVYLNKPRTCHNYQKVDVNNYIREELARILKPKITRLKGWRWLAKHCGDIIDRVGSVFYSSVFIPGGYIHVLGIDEPVIVVVAARHTREMEELIRRLQKSPYSVAVFIGDNSYTPKNALDVLRSKSRASQQEHIAQGLSAG